MYAAHRKWLLFPLGPQWGQHVGMKGGCHRGTQLTLRIHRLNPPFGDRSREKMAHGKETGQTARGRGMHEGSIPS